jgi:hypothetical protein
MKRKYDINEDYFNEINTKEKAYFLGFLYADGYNHKCEIRKSSSSVNLSLAEEDSYILELLLREVSSDKPLQRIELSERQNSYRLSLCSYKLCESLEKWGCMRKKTFKITFPDFLQEHLVSHFVRGYFDGDGSIYFSPGKYKKAVAYNLDFVGNLPFIESLGKILTDKFQVKPNIRVANKKTANQSIYRLRLCGKHKIIEILEWLYEDKGDFYLKRKYEKLINIKEYKNRKTGNKITTPCCIDNCNSIFYAKNLCRNHYISFRSQTRKHKITLSDFIVSLNNKKSLQQKIQI